MPQGSAIFKHCLYHVMPIQAGHSRVVCPDGLAPFIRFLICLLRFLPFPIGRNTGGQPHLMAYALSLIETKEEHTLVDHPASRDGNASMGLCMVLLGVGTELLPL